MSVVSVVVNKIARNVDKLYSYAVPESMEVQVGLRVIVPFGARSALTEGYIVATDVDAGNMRLKQIDSIVDEHPAFSEKMWQLAEWMHEKYLCTYIDALRLMMPTGVEIRFETWAELCDIGEDELEAMLKRSENRQEIVRIMRENGGSIELTRLMSMFEANVRQAITAMEKQGILRLTQRDRSTIKDKTVRFAALAVDGEQAKLIIDDIKKSAPKQAEILEILMYNERVAVADVLHLAQTTHNALAALCKKGLVELEDMEVMRNPMAGKEIEPSAPKPPTDEQKAALDKLIPALSDVEESGKINKTFLVHGVTGSGKTEVFMQLIAHAIKQGKSAIVLVPEISLTAQMVRRFASRFGERIAILHSGLSLGERFDEWKRIRGGEVDVVVGARSAVFAPLGNIGVIILDEEHENTYKSDMSPRYHAREVALFRAKQYNALCLLASATPDIDSYYAAQSGKYELIKLTGRYNGNEMPRLHIVDMRAELAAGNRSMFSKELHDALAENMQNGQQSILFLNRRGFSTFVSCRECGYVAKCPHCNISLTYHRHTNNLTCHYCGYNIGNYVNCPECNSKYIKYFGAGTQRLEEDLKAQFPGIGVVRMDLDTTGTKNAHEHLLDRFENDKVDVLIGTQMVSKGLDMHNVTLVGVVAADSSLYVDDYRSSERTFHLITQVAGRAGRGDLAGRAVVQTYSPENSAVVFASQHDYEGFYAEEIELRRAMWYPPFCDIISILVSGKNENMVIRRIREISRQLHFGMDGGECGRIHILGPVASGISKIKDKYRWRLVIKCENSDSLNEILGEVIAEHGKNANSKYLDLVIDKNPNNLA